MSIGTTLKSSIGAKALMAVTGIILVLFVIGHMLGNLQVFLGPEHLNAYAAFLQGLGELLWAIRAVLLLALLAHMWAAFRVVQLSKQARPIPYQQRKDLATSFAARTMWVTGILIFLFIVYHILHFTLGVIDPAGAFENHTAEGHHDVYRMVILSFQQWPTVAIYTVAMVILALHVSHGASSLLQTLGLRKPGNASCYDKVGPTIAAILLIGNLSMPLSIFAGLIG